MTDPCETCARWPECNGVDAETCPFRARYKEERSHELEADQGV